MFDHGGQWEQLQCVNDFTFESHLGDHRKFLTALGCWSDAVLNLIDYPDSLSMLSFADTLQLIGLCSNMYKDSTGLWESAEWTVWLTGLVQCRGMQPLPSDYKWYICVCVVVQVSQTVLASTLSFKPDACLGCLFQIWEKVKVVVLLFYAKPVWPDPDSSFISIAQTWCHPSEHFSPRKVRVNISLFFTNLQLSLPSLSPLPPAFSLCSSSTSPTPVSPLRSLSFFNLTRIFCFNAFFLNKGSVNIQNCSLSMFLSLQSRP